ncbi:hypothetical protein ACN2CC_08240 [Mesorhizobium muleiense]|uniref:hypothetical protein n=1 Tax=Mesorhizobium muleiense TaxID=1004279 RepID=UPI003AFA8322
MIGRRALAPIGRPRSRKGVIWRRHAESGWRGWSGLTDGLGAVEAACQEAIEHGASSAPVILNILARSRDPAPGTILSIPQALKLAHERSPTAPASQEDKQPWNAPRYWN